MLNRRQSREMVFSLLFELGFHENEDSSTIYNNALIERQVEENDYIKNTFFGVIKNRNEIDEVIKKNSVGWKIDRISRVALAIMRLSIYEIFYLDDIPSNISINEALELIKRYDDESARTFVNGVLDAAAKSVEKNG